VLALEAWVLALVFLAVPVALMQWDEPDLLVARM